MIQIGKKARLIQPVIEGKVLRTRFDESSGELEHLIGYQDSDSQPQERWFRLSQLEEIAS